MAMVVVSFQCHALGRAGKQRILEEAVAFIKSDDDRFDQYVAQADSLRTQGNISEESMYRMLSKLGVEFLYAGDHAQAVRYYRMLLPYFEGNDRLDTADKDFMLNVYVCLGAAYEELGMRNVAMDYYVKGLEIARKEQFEKYEAMFLNNIGVIYMRNDYPEKAESYFSQALAINKRIGNSEELYNNYNNLSATCESNGNLDRAMDNSLRALQYVSQKNDMLYYLMHINLGMLYFKKKEYQMALSYLNNAVEHAQGFPQVLFDGYMSLSRVYLETGRVDSASTYADNAEVVALQMHNPELLSRALKQKSFVAEARGSYKRANELLQRSYLITDSMQQVDGKQRLVEWEKIYNQNVGESNGDEVMGVSRKAFMQAVLPLSLMLVIVIVVLSALLLRNRRKVRSQSAAIAELTEKNGRLQCEWRQLKTEMQDAIDLHSRELTSFTIEKLQTGEYINDLGDELTQLLGEVNPRDKQHRQHIQSIVKKLQQFDNQNNWLEFQYYFAKVRPHFYENLEKLFPDLTTKDKRLCAFLCLDLSTKEIAQITFREVRSVESSRNRLRKKLGVSQETNLADFLKSVTGTVATGASDGEISQA